MQVARTGSGVPIPATSQPGHLAGVWRDGGIPHARQVVTVKY